MRYIMTVLLLATASLKANACLGPELERAQDRDAAVKFIGVITAYQIQKVKGLALVKFKVSKTLRGESRKTWSLYFRSNSLPANLAEFQTRFGRVIEVGAKKMIAPGEKSDSAKKAFYVVDAVCSMNGEDWLLRKVDPS